MMIRRQLSLTDLISAIQNQVNENTSLKCLDVVPDNTPSPFVYAEVVRVAPADTKVFYMKEYEVYLHVIADGKASSVPIYRYIQEVQEAMTEEIRLPGYVKLVTQTDAGLQTMFTEETGEKHAVLDYIFQVAYGYKIKV